MIAEALCLVFGVVCAQPAPAARPEPETAGVERGDYPPTTEAPAVKVAPLTVPPLAAAPLTLPVLTKPDGFPRDCVVQPPRELGPHFVAAARRYPGGATACELAKVSWCESRFQVDAVSPAGAKGPMQLVDATAREIGVTDPFDARDAIFGGAKYIAWCEARWTPGLEGRTDFDMRGLRAGSYNWGDGNMKRDQAKNGWTLYLDAEPGLPRETQEYFWCIERGRRG